MSAQGSLDQLFELLADRAGGEDVSDADLRGLLAKHPSVDGQSFERAAAAVHLALMSPAMEPMPVRLDRRLREQAEDFFRSEEGARSAPAPQPKRGFLRSPWPGWLVAAAAGLLLVVQLARTAVSPGSTFEEIARAPGALVLPWQRTEDPAAVQATGELVWSDALQEGFMRFRDLAQNDPAEGQYQLWIFDANRPSETPVDGGVFDVSGPETLVPIDAKLSVSDPTLFAVTWERPGGVVVSDRERIVVTAAPE